eukprot:1134328-Prorocentrum_minimum.AAC.1
MESSPGDGGEVPLHDSRAAGDRSPRGPDRARAQDVHVLQPLHPGGGAHLPVLLRRLEPQPGHHRAAHAPHARRDTLQRLRAPAPYQWPRARECQAKRGAADGRVGENLLLP